MRNPETRTYLRRGGDSQHLTLAMKLAIGTVLVFFVAFCLQGDAEASSTTIGFCGGRLIDVLLTVCKQYGGTQTYRKRNDYNCEFSFEFSFSLQIPLTESFVFACFFFHSSQLIASICRSNLRPIRLLFLFEVLCSRFQRDIELHDSRGAIES